jgi:hypothetical protein
MDGEVRKTIDLEDSVAATQGKLDIHACVI